MTLRIKSALFVFVGLLGAFLTVFVFDYTDDYMEDRFVRAIETQRSRPHETFSLDALMEHYDWDVVCIRLPGDDHSLKTRLGRRYKGKKLDTDHWSLIFVKGTSVLAEIPVEHAFLLPPETLNEQCFERWAAIFSLAPDQDGRFRMNTVGQ